jgi:Nucleoside 2-deoxyribosyltransferase like
MILTCTAPTKLDKPSRAVHRIFLAGGITNCPDWQSEAIEWFDTWDAPELSVVLYNPRRPEFDIRDPKESEKQIQWEFENLLHAHKILFWFPKETLCPITLFELGKELGYGMSKGHHMQNIFIGAHPEYQRRIDLEIQTKLFNWGGKIHTNVKDLVADVVVHSILAH